MRNLPRGLPSPEASSQRRAGCLPWMPSDLFPSHTCLLHELLGQLGVSDSGWLMSPHLGNPLPPLPWMGKDKVLPCVTSL